MQPGALQQTQLRLRQGGDDADHQTWEWEDDVRQVQQIGRDTLLLPRSLPDHLLVNVKSSKSRVFHHFCGFFILLITNLILVPQLITTLDISYISVLIINTVKATQSNCK